MNRFTLTFLVFVAVEFSKPETVLKDGQQGSLKKLISLYSKTQHSFEVENQQEMSLIEEFDDNSIRRLERKVSKNSLISVEEGEEFGDETGPPEEVTDWRFLDGEEGSTPLPFSSQSAIECLSSDHKAVSSGKLQRGSPCSTPHSSSIEEEEEEEDDLEEEINKKKKKRPLPLNKLQIGRAFSELEFATPFPEDADDGTDEALLETEIFDSIEDFMTTPLPPL